MSLRGAGIVAIWNGIRDEGRRNFFEWHNREHMPERVGIPGFLAGRRYQSSEASPEFFTLYETRSTQVLDGEDYLTRLNHPTEWTRRSVAFFTDVARALCEVRISHGIADGGWLQTWRYDVPDAHAGAHIDAMRAHLSSLQQLPGVVGAHLCSANLAASDIQTEEKKGRPKADVPRWVLLVEHTGDGLAPPHLPPEALSEQALVQTGAVGPFHQGWYRLQVMRWPEMGHGGSDAGP